MVHLVVHARLAGSLVRKVHCRAMNVTRISILFLHQSTVTLLVLLVVTSILAKHAHIVRQGRPFQLQILKWNVRFVQRARTVLLLALQRAPIVMRANSASLHHKTAQCVLPARRAVAERPNA